MGEFSNNIVNQRFKMVFDELEKVERVKSKSDIATKLGTYNHVVNAILKGDRNITVEQLHKLFETYNISANFIFGFSDSIFLDDADYIVTHPKSEQLLNAKGKQNIALVPDRAVAGYATTNDTPQYLAEFPRFSIPNLEGNLVAFEISGNSMEPTITNGDIVVCEELERGEPVRDNQVYVVVTDVVVAKRIQQVKEGAQVKYFNLISDNGFYKPYPILPEEINKILRIKCRLTSHAIL